MYILIHVSDIFFWDVYRLNCCENETVILFLNVFISLSAYHVILIFDQCVKKSSNNKIIIISRPMT